MLIGTLKAIPLSTHNRLIKQHCFCKYAQRCFFLGTLCGRHMKRWENWSGACFVVVPSLLSVDKFGFPIGICYQLPLFKAGQTPSFYPSHHGSGQGAFRQIKAASQSLLSARAGKLLPIRKSQKKNPDSANGHNSLSQIFWQTL